MELMPYKDFAKLRMGRFAPGRKVSELDDVEWMGGFWISEMMSGCPGLSSVLRHEETPEEAGGLELDFRDFPKKGVVAIFEAIHLPLRPGMTSAEVRSVLGEPEKIHTFLEDRKGYDFTIGSQYPYLVSCTVRDTLGLIGVAVVRKDILSRCRY